MFLTAKGKTSEEPTRWLFYRTAATNIGTITNTKANRKYRCHKIDQNTVLVTDEQNGRVTKNRHASIPAHVINRVSGLLK